MKSWVRRLGAFLICFLVVGATLWGGLALWYTLPIADAVRGGLASVYFALGAGGLVIAFVSSRLVLPLLPFAVAFVTVLVWWSSIEASNDRIWQGDVRTLPSAEIEGDVVTLRNIRNFQYRSTDDYNPRWYDKTIDLKQLDTLDVFAVYWMGDAIAHTILSFGFGGEYVAISIEIRKEQDEVYSAAAGFFRQYELHYVVADERDVIGLRTTYRRPPEDVYLYRTNLPRSDIRQLFLEYLKKINALQKAPEFYNTATTNCTTNILFHVRAFKEIPRSWKVLLSGYFPELLYERGRLNTSLPFEVLRRKSLINERARAADGSADFSRLIREGLPGSL